jgi:hypothetical protein
MSVKFGLSLKAGIQVDDGNQGLSLMELKQLVTPMMDAAIDAAMREEK